MFNSIVLNLWSYGVVVSTRDFDNGRHLASWVRIPLRPINSRINIFRRIQII
jgi:hypothetical protein